MNSPCFFIKPPRVAIVYIYPINGQGGFSTKAVEFTSSYHRNPPGMEHDTIVVCNGAPATDPSKELFYGLPNVTFLDHDNSGWDIGGFQMASQRSEADMMVFFGAHSYFRRAGWLARMSQAYEELGNTLYGATGSQGNIGVGVYPHVRTTAFWCSRELFNAYPHRVLTEGGGGQRYEMEHGKSCLTNWVKGLGRQPWIVGWNSIFPIDQCDQMPGGYHRDDQHNVLVGDRLTGPPFHGTP